MTELWVGWTGTCKEHKTQPSVARDTGGTVLLKHNKCQRPIISRILEIRCATGHGYLAVDRDDFLHDPFAEEVEAKWIEEFEKGA